ncbi:MAG TPA: DUF3093 domain-containing protein [Sporichthyaceae bacterium]|nr:DUF3093 domain-containing protein [Sporichthyaceae bacterium]
MTAPEAQGTYRERLRVPVAWWFIPVSFLVVLTLGTGRYLGAVAAMVTAVLFVGLVVTGLLRYGAIDLVVDVSGFRAGPHSLPRAALGAAAPLDVAQARALCGPRADARALLMIRGYVPAGVRLDVLDPGNPAPYWYVSSRHPHELAAALNAVRHPAD